MINEVTVIVRTFNSEDMIVSCLESITKQKNVIIKLLIVDSGSTDSTLDLIQNYPHEIINIPAGTYIPGPVLNTAISKSETDIVVFVNSDVALLSDKTISYLIEPIKSDGAVVATFGRQIARPEAELYVKYEYSKSFPRHYGDSPSWMHYSLPIAALKKSTWDDGFQFYQDSWGSEDTHLGVLLKNSGFQVLYIPRAIAMHSHNYTFRQLKSRMEIEGAADFYIFPNSKPSFFKMFIKQSLLLTFVYAKNKQFSRIPYIILNKYISAKYYMRGFKKSKNKETVIGNYQ